MATRTIVPTPITKQLMSLKMQKIIRLTEHYRAVEKQLQKKLARHIRHPERSEGAPEKSIDLIQPEILYYTQDKLFRKLQKKIIVFLFSLLSSTCYATDAWFTGPLIAPEAETIPLGHISLELYSYFIFSQAIYDQHWNAVSSNYYNSIQTIPEISYGLSDRMDVVIDPLYEHNHTGNVSNNNIGDTSITLGFQLLKQEENHHQPNLRFTVQEIFPSGRYDRLQPANDGTDATGTGSYQTGFGLNFEYLSHLTPAHDLNTHLSLLYFYPSDVRLNGTSAYGGNALTNGVLTPGQLVSIDIAGELSITQNWVAVLETYYLYQQSSSFKGNRNIVTPDATNSSSSETPTKAPRRKFLRRFFPTRLNIRGLQTDRSDIGNGTLDQFTLAPAIEYNFSENYGVIVGSWFTILGKNTTKFNSLAVAFNAYW
jgi:hypothetical protein